MPVSFKIPKSPQKSIEQINEFKGVDFSNSPANCDVTKSPNAVNMIRDVPGKVRKRMGYKINKTYAGKKINGYHSRKGDNYALIHAGTYIYKSTDDTVLYSSANDAISHSWEFDTNLYIMDGKKLLKYDGTNVKVVENDADTYIPTLTIAKSPSGGGQEYESINLLNSAFIELFQGDGSSTAYHMTFGELDATTVKAWIMNAQGEWVAKTEGTHFSVDRPNGIINWDAPPPVPDLTGEDNVKIQVYRTVSGYADRINKCRFGTRFGVNGAFDRLFVSGNPDWANADWYSQQWDCTYFPDMSYSRLGSSRSAIVGYSIISNYLAAHKDEMERDLSIVLREGDLVDDEPSFKIINTLQGAGAIAQNSFAYLCTEPIFLTRSGLYAVTAQDITGEKYAQSRSFYLNGKLTQESLSDLQNSYAIIYKDMYLLSVGGNRLYVLDGIQPMRTDKSEPYATRQYAGFYCEDIPARIMWESENKLFFGTADGKICEFYTDKDSLSSYSDQTGATTYKAISCKWETPDIDGQLFYKNKTLRYIAVRIGAAIATSVDIYGMDKGLWRLLRRDTTTGRYLVFSVLQFSKFSFSSDTTQKVSHTKVKIKKVDKYRIRLENNEINEPFSIYDIGLEYVEGGNYKG